MASPLTLQVSVAPVGMKFTAFPTYRAGAVACPNAGFLGTGLKTAAPCQADGARHESRALNIELWPLVRVAEPRVQAWSNVALQGWRGEPCSPVRSRVVLGKAWRLVISPRLMTRRVPLDHQGHRTLYHSGGPANST
ncbi:uncharacterized protein PGTG_09136 [Puccinia graminis f. sp. tritici CRL 75-36-700-3]|uniref:Uncharacterized protein n=1 Tax=Puccinia graminis f. sp. tritici (strain CRL 75-36-700-3 / race SCCL) TaxID=418459 RepID=E3KG88_PUCGT|nr:uncharacterized protein PGTG_09136 [Puccinia graminis f. sp. tritici CRL 75-36-700-3]EFP83183.2 hypothetical protein PGTG_09136 [Puccinia graminis f. sp. tritici CRL 75-36-700-3]